MQVHAQAGLAALVAGACVMSAQAQNISSGLYLGGSRKLQSIVGMDQAEAKELLDELWARATEAAHVWGQEWKPGDMVMWDNRCTLHRRDPFDPNSIRLMHRTTVEGERPIAAD